MPPRLNAPEPLRNPRDVPRREDADAMPRVAGQVSGGVVPGGLLVLGVLVLSRSVRRDRPGVRVFADDVSGQMRPGPVGAEVQRPDPVLEARVEARVVPEVVDVVVRDVPEVELVPEGVGHRSGRGIPDRVVELVALPADPLHPVGPLRPDLARNPERHLLRVRRLQRALDLVADPRDVGVRQRELAGLEVRAALREEPVEDLLEGLRPRDERRSGRRGVAAAGRRQNAVDRGRIRGVVVPVEGGRLAGVRSAVRRWSPGWRRRSWRSSRRPSPCRSP